MISDFFKNIFKGKTDSNKTYQDVKPYNTYSPTFWATTNNAYDRLVYRACIDAIAKQVAKLTPTVNITVSDKYFKNLKYLLNNKPNECMNRYEFFYKITSMLFDKNNCFIYVRNVDGVITDLYPVDYSQIKFVEYDNEIYAQFQFLNRGYEVTIPYSELIHLRRHYNSDILFGCDQTEILKPLFRVLDAVDRGLINSVDASSELRGLLKYTGALNEEDLKRKKEQFVKDYMQDGDGVGIVDTKLDFVPLKIEPKTINSSQCKLILEYFNYTFGVSEQILKGVANEDEYNAFYELTIEPLLVQLSLEFTNKIFLKEEIEKGCEIQLTANKLLFANVSTKTSIAKEIMPLGIFSINEVREMFGYEHIADGDKNVISLNYIDIKNAERYQVGSSE